VRCGKVGWLCGGGGQGVLGKNHEAEGKAAENRDSQAHLPKGTRLKTHLARDM